MPIDYSKGKIYKIIDLDSNECYIGSTCEPTLARRLAGHVSCYKSYLNGNYHYVTSFKIIQNGDYDIVLIENYPCNSKDELHARESHYTQSMDCVNKVKKQGLINKIGKVEYGKQYREDNKEQLKEQMKQYNEANKDKIKQYYEDNKEQIKERSKQYYEANKEQIKEQTKQYRGDNREQIKQYREQYREEHKKEMNQKHDCECGGCYTICHKARHYKTSKHQIYEKNKIKH
jgi:hypothetical protein